MRKHIIILAILWLLLGYLLGATVISVHTYLLPEVIDAARSVTAGRGPIYQIYMNQFARYGIYPSDLLMALWTVGTAIAFGHGLLRYKEWAWWLGLLLAAINSVSTIWSISSGGSLPVIGAQAGLCIHTLWVLLDEDVKNIFRGKVGAK